MLGERKGPAGWLGESPHLSTAPRKKGADLSGLTGQDSRRSSPFQAFSPWENLFPSCMLLPAPKPFQKTFGDWPVKSGVFARMLRCARSGYRPSPRPPGVGGSGSARPPPSRKPPPWGPRGKGTVPAGKFARSNVLPLGGTEGGEHSFRSLLYPRICRLTSDLLPSEANSAPLLRGAVLGDADPAAERIRVRAGAGLLI